MLSLHKTWVHGVVEIPPLVHPDLGHASRVLVDDLGHAAGEGVRRLVAEDVAHVRARDDLQDAAALPNLHNASFLKIIICTKSKKSAGKDIKISFGHTAAALQQQHG